MKNRFLKTLLTVSVMVLLTGMYSSTVSAMTQAEADEWFKQYCEENGLNPDDFRGTGGTRSDLYVGNQENKVRLQNSSDNKEETTSSPSEIPKHEHKYTANLTKDPTCTDEGVITYTCTCGDTYTEAQPMLTHQYQEEITKEATCTEDGEKVFTCSLCGDSYKETIKATSHNESDWQITKPSTCNESGERKMFCLTCNTELEKEEIPISEHTPGEVVITKKPTLFAEGENIISCAVCGAVLETNAIPVNKTSQITFFSVLGATLLILIIIAIIIVKKKRKSVH